MPPALRPGSFLDRVARAATGRGVAPFDMSWYQHTGMPPLFHPQQSLGAYGDNVYLYRSVLTISMEIARIDFKLRTQRKDGEYDPVKSHVALDTLRRPQPSKEGKTILTGFALKMLTGMHLMLNGEAFWLLEKRMKIGGAPSFVQPLLPQYMNVKPSADGDVVEYIYRTGMKETRFDPADIVHFKLVDPENPYRGHSPVQAIRYAVDTKKKADQMNTSRLSNYAVPAGVLETDQEVPDQERKRLLDEWNSKYKGVGNADKTAMLPRGLKFNKTQESNRDLQFVEANNMTRDEVLANYGVGMEIFGRTEAQTRANAESAIFIFQRFGVLPFVDLMRDTLDNDYLFAFPGTDGMQFWHDEIVPENMEEKRLNMDTAFRLGALTPNEVRKQLGLDAIEQEGMDVPYLDLGKIPVGQDFGPDPPLA